MEGETRHGEVTVEALQGLTPMVRRAVVAALHVEVDLYLNDNPPMGRIGRSIIGDLQGRDLIEEDPERAGFYRLTPRGYATAMLILTGSDDVQITVEEEAGASAREGLVH